LETAMSVTSSARRPARSAARATRSRTEWRLSAIELTARSVGSAARQRNLHVPTMFGRARSPSAPQGRGQYQRRGAVRHRALPLLLCSGDAVSRLKTAPTRNFSGKFAGSCSGNVPSVKVCVPVMFRRRRVAVENRSHAEFFREILTGLGRPRHATRPF
jgi:hypothetical protein